MGGSHGSGVDPQPLDYCPDQHKGWSTFSLAYLKLSLTEPLNFRDRTVTNQIRVLLKITIFGRDL